MKNKLTVMIIIALIALVAGNYLLGTDYLRQSRANEAMTANITAGSGALARTPQPPPDLKQKLAEAESQLAAAQGDFPQDLNSTRLIDAILRLADRCQVKAIPLVTSPWAKDKTGEGYDTFRLNLAVSGGFVQVASFISQLENGELESLVVENLTVKTVAGTGETIPVTASLDLAIYSRLTAPGKGELP